LTVDSAQVLGGAFLVQGIRFKEQYFNQALSSTLTSLSTFGPFCSIFLYIFYATRDETFPHRTTDGIVLLSHAMAIICLITNLLHLIFRFKTHNEFFLEDEDPDDDAYPRLLPDSRFPTFPERSRQIKFGGLPDIPEDMEDQQEESSGRHPSLLPDIARVLDRKVQNIFGFGPRLSYGARMAAIVMIAGLMMFTTETISKNVILLSVRQNRLLALFGLSASTKVWTHLQSLQLAYREKCGAAIDRVVGASLQMGLLVAPGLVLMGWALGVPLTLRFDLFETVAYGLSLWMVALLLRDGKADWMKGVMLVGVYSILSLGAFLYL
jgi:Ca2+/H+ antiporter